MRATRTSVSLSHWKQLLLIYHVVIRASENDSRFNHINDLIVISILPLINSTIIRPSNFYGPSLKDTFWHLDRYFKISFSNEKKKKEK